MGSSASTKPDVRFPDPDRPLVRRSLGELHGLALVVQVESRIASALGRPPATLGVEALLVESPSAEKGYVECVSAPHPA